MTGQCKPSEGPWNGPYVRKDKFEDGFAVMQAEGIGSKVICCGCTEDDAHIIIEAGTVYHETKLTPRQLLAQRDELLAALKEVLYGYELGHFSHEVARDAKTAIANAEKE